jgi:hypothetical protein
VQRSSWSFICNRLHFTNCNFHSGARSEKKIRPLQPHIPTLFTIITITVRPSFISRTKTDAKKLFLSRQFDFCRARVSGNERRGPTSSCP